MSLAAAAAARGPGAVWSPTHVQVTVLQARGLRAKGPGGTSDAYAVIQVGKEKYATSVSERSLGAPVWREEATFELPPLLSDGAAATLQLTVLHRALLGLDKFLGRAEVDLRELHRAQGRRRTQWFPLKSKPGKKEKDRGEIEVDVQFMRNNMTASMFDLSMKDKSRNPFGKLKDKIKGKSKDSASDTSSAIVPGSLASGDSDDESSLKDKKKKSKIKTLFSKSALQKTPLSQSMSVLPTSKSDRVLLRPGDFQSRWGDEEEEDNEDQPSTASDAPSPRRAAAAEPRPLSQVSLSLPRKDGLSFLGGLRSKNDLLSRSNVCINGNHVYAEPPEAKDSSPSSSPSPQSARKRQLFSSMENLVASPEPPTARAPARDPRESPPPAHSEAGREAKETKKQEGKKSSLLSLVTGKKDVARASEGDSPPAAPRREKETGPAETGAAETRVKLVEDGTAGVPERAPASNPFEEVHVGDPEAGPESTPKPTVPVPAPRAPQTKAVKPRPHPVKPMNTTATKIANSSLGTATVISEKLINEALMKKYNPSDPAFAYAQLTHDELIQLVLKQKEAISKKEFQVRELEDYIDNLLVRVMEETPNILRVPAQVGKKAGKM
ncbi:rab11 family-interacting protein 1 [Sorex fumeus]|uniref:rab11 family-interacting protein 1 n=1 Tax=Sorex fumeus TaxID=62283 RepID=UPI0024AD306A|nr:rab11 family-interacting protein 1 [Sorex fumeus]